jgi:hypothetical protein
MLISFVDLKIQYSEIKTELQRAIEGILKKGGSVEETKLKGSRRISHNWRAWGS